ncbi:alpha/beta hydrolase family protein [Bradyrhizobium sp. 2TAF24]|uniref:alpha/beta hydrolase family protein n=1 Tax=Bradyrhizobium sp. 2TAF24 TaxID=3233011 RepID=UPI003F8FCDC1
MQVHFRPSRLGLVLLFALLTAAAPAPAQSPPAGETVWVNVTQRLKTRVYESPGRGADPVLVVVLHGDAPRRPPTYQYRFAASVAAALPNVVAAAVLRPGYSDGDERSDGMRGETTGDNYTPEVIDAVTAAITALKERYHPRAVVLVGHSGGAAIAADLLGSGKGGADATLLVSCPCDLAAWRQHMHSVQGGAIWERPVRSLSPIAEADGVPLSTKVTLLVGSQDDVAPPALTQAYAETLRKRGVAVRADVVEGLPHDILLEPVVIDRLRDIVDAVRAAR